MMTTKKQSVVANRKADRIHNTAPTQNPFKNNKQEHTSHCAKGNRPTTKWCPSRESTPPYWIASAPTSPYSTLADNRLSPKARAPTPASAPYGHQPQPARSWAAARRRRWVRPGWWCPALAAGVVLRGPRRWRCRSSCCFGAWVGRRLVVGAEVGAGHDSLAGLGRGRRCGQTRRCGRARRLAGRIGSRSRRGARGTWR